MLRPNATRLPVYRYLCPRRRRFPTCTELPGVFYSQYRAPYPIFNHMPVLDLSYFGHFWLWRSKLILVFLAGLGWFATVFAGFLLASGRQSAWAPFHNLGGPKMKWLPAQTSGLWFPKGVTQPGPRFTRVLPIFRQSHFTHFLPILPVTRRISVYPGKTQMGITRVRPIWVTTILG